MKISRTAKWIIVIAAAFLSIVIGVIIYGAIGRYRLLQHHEAGTGEVIGCTKGVKGSPDACNVRYRYTVDGATYEGRSLFQPSALRYEDCLEHLTGHTFPIVYETGNANNTVLLLTPGAFRLYGYNFPDSLRWVQEYVHEK